MKLSFLDREGSSLWLWCFSRVMNVNRTFSEFIHQTLGFSVDDSDDSSSGQKKNSETFFLLKKHLSSLKDYLPKVLSLAFGVWTFGLLFVSALLLCSWPVCPVHMPGPLDKISHLQVAIQHRGSWFFTFQIFFQNHFRIFTPLIEGLMS